MKKCNIGFSPLYIQNTGKRRGKVYWGHLWNMSHLGICLLFSFFWFHFCCLTRPCALYSSQGLIGCIPLFIILLRSRKMMVMKWSGHKPTNARPILWLNTSCEKIIYYCINICVLVNHLTFRNISSI